MYIYILCILYLLGHDETYESHYLKFISMTIDSLFPNYIGASCIHTI
jgi:hypothetical protein